MSGDLKAWLPFNRSPTEDLCGNSWTAFGSPTISNINAINCNALQLDGASFLQTTNFELGGQDFTVCGWIYVDSSSPAYARVIHVYNSNGYSLFSLRKNASDGTKLDFWVNTEKDVSIDNGWTCVSSIDSIGKRVHFELDYSYSKRTMTLFIDGVKAATRNPCSQFNRMAYTILVGAWSIKSQQVTGTIEELQIYDGVALHSANFTPPTADDYFQLALNTFGKAFVQTKADVARNINNAPLTWIYKNPGTADLLSISGTTLNNLPVTQSKTGVAFYQTTRAKCFDLPTTPEIWIKFDVYFDGTNRWRAYNDNDEGNSTLDGVCAQTSGSFSFFASTNNSVYNPADVCKKNTLQTVLLHMQAGATKGFVEAWVDGNFIYCYTGNVNNGQAFADVYLQSDGSGTFFSNVIISNGQIGLNENVSTYDITIKPEIYASWIPDGQVLVKPKIYATYIPGTYEPTLEKATADLNRKVAINELIHADLLRPVGQAAVRNSDLLRKIIYSESISADTNRKITATDVISGDIIRKIGRTICIPADTNRQVQQQQKIIGDTSRRISNTTEKTVVIADLFRKVNVSTNIIGDTRRKVTIKEKSSGDTCLQISRRENITADTCREVTVTTKSYGDTARKLGAMEKIFADTFRNIILATNERTSADTFLQITKTEKITGDLNRGLRDFARADACRQITRTEKAIASTVIRVPHILNYTLSTTTLQTMKPRFLTDNLSSLVNTFIDYGVTAANITLNERTLSDDFHFDVSRALDINDAVQGTLFDYPFHFLVEETNQTELTQSIKGMYNQDELLYTQFFLPIAEIDDQEEVIPIPASQHMRNIARHLNLSADIKIDNFTPYNLNGDSRITYSDLINSLFGWTSRLPQRQVNVFIRGGTLHCIQRGKEENVFDITDLPHSRPTVNKKLIRSLWSNPKDDSKNDPKEPTEYEDPTIEYLYDDNPTPFSGTIEFSDEGVSTILKYSAGLLVRETNEMANSKSTVSSSVTYEYEELFPSTMSEISIFVQKSLNKNFYGDFYLSSKNLKLESTSRDTDETLKMIVQTGVTTYRYTKTDGDDVYLNSEAETLTKTTYTQNEKGIYEQTDSSTDIRETFHVPIGNGWYGQSVYLNGEAQGSNISQGKPGNKVSQYTIAQVQSTFKGWTITYTYDPNDPHSPNYQAPSGNQDDDTYSDWRRKLSPIMDMSFPVREFDIVQALTNALRWLNRKIQETVTVDLIPEVINGIPSCFHIVDFTERVRLNDAEYFLVSNRITFTPRKFVQRLELIRWY